MTKYNLTAAVIGTGYIGIQHLEALKTLVSEVIVCNADEENGRAVAEKYGCRFYSDYIEMFKKEKLDFGFACNVFLGRYSLEIAKQRQRLKERKRW